jgi:3-(3-hydroxy-phenyl)propionate hydroxylase
MTLPVVIAGAGPVGLTAALALSQRDIEVIVVDHADGIDPRMRASTFHPPTLDFLDDLGVAAPLVAAGIQVRRWQMRQHESDEQVTFDMQTIADRTRHPYRLQLPQQRLCEVLLDELGKRGVEIHFRTTLTHAVDHDQGVSIAINGLGDLKAGWLIGADGSRSAVRQSMGLDYGGKTYTHASVLVSTSFPFHEHLTDLADVAYSWSARGPFSLLRQPSLWRASLYPGLESLSEAATEDRVREWLAFIAPEARDAEIVDISPYRVHERCVSTFRVGRMMLAGDAAHLNPPSGGMGMNGGIHDAINLAEKLALVIGGEDDALLDHYSRQRLFVASEAVIPQAVQHRRRMMVIDRDMQLERLAEQRAIASDPERVRDFLLRASMIAGLEAADGVE